MLWFMFRHAHRRLTFLVLSVALLSTGEACSADYSFNVPSEVLELQPNKHAQINSRTQRTLAQAWSDFEKQQSAKALSTLERVISENQHNPVATSYALYSASQILAQLEQYELAIGLIQLLLRLDSLNESSQVKQHLLLAQLQIQTGHFSEASQALQTLISSQQPNQSIEPEQLSEWYYLLSYSQFQTKDYSNCFNSAKHALKLAHPKQEALYQLQLNSLLALKDYPASRLIIEKLISLEPTKKAYWQQWVRIAIQLGEHQQALSGMELLKETQALSATEVLHLSQLQLSEGLPFQAALILEAALSEKTVKATAANIKRLAYSWEQAGHNEKAIDILSSSSFITNYQDSADNLVILKQLSRLLVKQALWNEVIQVIHEVSGGSYMQWLALEKDYNKDKVLIGLELGRSLFYSDKLNMAETLFTALDDHLSKLKQSKANRHQADTIDIHIIEKQLAQWTNYLANISKH